MLHNRPLKIGCIVLVVAFVILAKATNMRLVRFRARGERAAGKVRLDYVCWGDVTEQELNRHWLGEFEKQHPNITVKFDPRNPGE